MKTLLRTGFCALACFVVLLSSISRAQNQLVGNLTVSNNTTLSGSSGRLISVNPLSAFNVASGVTPFVELEVDSTSTSSPRGIMSAQYSTGTDGARFHMRKARGTRASPTTVVTGDNLGRIVGTGYDGTNYLENANITFGTEGTIAATRVPTTIAFSTATNAAPSVVTLAATINSAQQFVNNVGSAAAPSYTFAGLTTDGLYSVSSGNLGLTSAGTRSFTFGGSGVLTGASTQTVTMGTAGAIALAAAGTNQSITLTPSGTGGVSILSAATDSNFIVASSGTAGVYQYFKSATSTARGVIGYDTNSFVLYSMGSLPLTFGTNSVERMRLSSAGNLLLGALATDGTGVLQFPAATTSAGGITFGTDVNIFRNASNSLQLSVPTVVFNSGRVEAAGNDFYVSSTNASGALILRSGSATTAITLDSSQNATFAKLITSYNGIATAGNGVSTVQGAGSVTAQTAAASSIAAYTVGASDADFIVSGQVTVTASTTHSFSLECAYTDAATNTARTLTFNTSQLNGTLSTLITAAIGVGPYEAIPLHLRAKASTAITIRTNSGGTYTSVTYAASGVIQKLQ